MKTANKTATLKRMSNKNIEKAAKALEYMRTTEPLWNIESLEERFMGANGRIYFKVRWEDGSYTDEPRDKLIREVRGMVQQFERVHKGGKRTRRSKKHGKRKTCKSGRR